MKRVWWMALAWSWAWWIAVALIFCTMDANAEIKKDFPRLGGIKIGSPHAYAVPAVQAQLARLDYVVVSFIPSWGTPVEMRGALRAIKSINPKILLVDYHIQETIHNTFPGQKVFRDKLDAEKWWLYRNGTTGPRATHDPTATTANFTDAVPKDANGDRYNTWFAKRVFADRWSMMPELDGTFTDNVFWKQRAAGDWQRNGTTNSDKDVSVMPMFRKGMVTHLDTLRALMPGKLVVGNIGDWGRPEASVPEYAGKLNGGLLEQYIGNSWSMEGVDMNGTFNGWGSWDRMMDGYRKVSALVKDPRLIILGMKGRPTDYKSFRYGFASTLMGEGHFDFSDGTSGSVYKTSVVWFDEYAPEGRTTSWLGAAIDPPPTAPWRLGVWRRRFQGGVALVNPRGNGAQTVTLEDGYRRIKGRQAPAVNDGTTAVRVTLADRDGLILVAGGPRPSPMPTIPPPLVCPVGCVPAP